MTVAESRNRAYIGQETEATEIDSQHDTVVSAPSFQLLHVKEKEVEPIRLYEDTDIPRDMLESLHPEHLPIQA